MGEGVGVGEGEGEGVLPYIGCIHVCMCGPKGIIQPFWP